MPTTWHCPHSHAAAAARLLLTAGPPAVQQSIVISLLLAGLTVANPPQCPP